MSSANGVTVKISRAYLLKYHLRVRRKLLGCRLANLVSRRRVISGDSNGPIVSLTTYGPRIQTVYYAIESIAGGTRLPSRLILWLDDRTLFENLPASLKRLQARGLEVRLTENYGPHTKYYPYVLSEAEFRNNLVLADDDALYSRRWLELLIAGSKSHPADINCWLAKVLSMTESKISPFNEWAICSQPDSSFRYVAHGIGGVSHPPAMLRAIRQAGAGFRDICPKADDIWLHVVALRAGVKTRQLPTGGQRPDLIPGTQDTGLWHENHGGGNDRQIEATYRSDDIAVLKSDAIDAITSDAI